MLPTAAHAGVASAGETLQGRVASDRSSLCLWTIVAAGTILRLVALGHKSFWLDEIASVAIARRPTPDFWPFLWHDEANMAAYYVVLQPWLHFGYREFVVRLLSVIPGVLSIPLMYALGRRLFGCHTGLIAAALLALSPCAVSVSQEARAYSFVVLLVLLSTWLFVRLIETPTYTLAVVYAAIAALTFYFHYFGILVPAAHSVVLIVLPASRHRWRPLLLAAGIIVVTAAPILWLIHAQDVGHIAWVGSPSWLELYHLGAFLAADSGKAVGAVLLAADLVLIVVFFANLKNLWLKQAAESFWQHVLVASLVVTPIAITLAASLVRPAFYHRFLVICLPGWVLMMAVGLTQIPSRRWPALGIVCGLSLISVVLLYQRPSEDWRGVVAYLAQHTQPDDRVLYYESVGQFAGENYRDWLQGATKPRPVTIGVLAGSMVWQTQLEGAAHVWLVLYRTTPGGPEARDIQQELATRFRLVETRKFAGIVVLEYGPA